MMQMVVTWLKSFRHILTVPNLPRPRSLREPIADVLFIFLRFLAKMGFLIGAVIGFFTLDGAGFFLGLVAGAFCGFLIRYSLALRKGHPTHAFFVRMQERAHSHKPKLLESCVELVRGTSLDISCCRHLASAYEEYHHHLQTCESDIERKRLYRKFQRTAFTAMYGQRPYPESEREVELMETQDAKADV
jgi:hypothetical protein